MNLYGDGRVVYIPKIRQSQPFGYSGWTWAPGTVVETVERAGYKRVRPNQWKLPDNWSELVEAIEWASKGRLSVKVYAPLAVVAELLVKEERKQMMLHLVNFDEKNSVEDLSVDLRMPPKREVEGISILSPDFEGRKSIDYSEIKDRALFKVPKLMIYDLILIQLK